MKGYFGVGGVLLPVITTACAGNVSTARLAPDAHVAGGEVRGVRAYQPMFAKLTYVFCRRVDDDGMVSSTGSSAGRTQIVQRHEITILADLAAPVSIRNAAGWLSGAKYSLSLAFGILSSVNAEPTKKPFELLAAIWSFAKEVSAMGVAIDAGIAYNVGRAISRIERITITDRR